MIASFLRAIRAFLSNTSASPVPTQPAARALQKLTPPVGVAPVVAAAPSARPAADGDKRRVAKLIMVTADNNNKYYEMEENVDGATFTVRFGRVGSKSQEATYGLELWEKKMAEKIRKGYIDHTHLFAAIDARSDTDTIADADVRTLIETLLRYAKNSISEHYVVTAEQVTRRQVEEAQTLLNELVRLAESDAINPDVFNLTLLAYFKVIPRKMKKVGEHLVKETPADDAALAALRARLLAEQETLDIMRGQVELNATAAGTPEAPRPLLERLGLHVEPVADAHVEQLVRRMMGAEARRLDRIFRVINHRTQAAFEQRRTGAVDARTELLWHGSRNENWLSILKAGLVLRPSNAIISGKMFGYGVYFADKFVKSLNYTSIYHRGEAYLAIYAVHLGRPLKIRQHDNWCYELNAKTLAQRGSYDSVFAESGVSLRNNEYIVYDETQSTIQYLVKIK